MTGFRERPDSWYDSPDEVPDSVEDECYDKWLEYLADDYCEKCSWSAGEDDALVNVAPCAECARGDYAPQAYEQFRQDFLDDRARA